MSEFNPENYFDICFWRFGFLSSWWWDAVTFDDGTHYSRVFSGLYWREVEEN